MNDGTTTNRGRRRSRRVRGRFLDLESIVRIRYSVGCLQIFMDIFMDIFRYVLEIFRYSKIQCRYSHGYIQRYSKIQGSYSYSYSEIFRY